MKIIKKLLHDVLILQSDNEISDGVSRSFYNLIQLAEVGISENFIQENQSLSHLNVLRGMHYQEVNPQGKLIQVLSGSIFDVVVDLRSSSSTFGKCATHYLNAKTNEFIWVPPGYAHGFLSLEEESIINYKVTEYRNPNYERTLMWNDKFVNIPWPLNNIIPILSEKDNSGKSWHELNYFN
jgi:dTDP-4-dehydrorhamnose 3,5-epimerase